MYEIEAEVIKGRVFFSSQDLIALCEGSETEEDTPFNAALKNLAKQLRDMEAEVHEDTNTQDPPIFAPLG